MQRHLLPLALLTLAAPAAGQDQLVKQALQRIEKYEGLVGSMQPGDVKTANTYLTNLKWAAKRLNASYDKTDQHYLAAVERYNALVQSIQAAASAGSPAPAPGAPALDLAALQQLDKEIRNGAHNLGLLNVTHMGDAFRVGSVRKELAGLKQRLAAMPAEHAAVQEVAARFRAFEQQFATLHGQYTADIEAAGDRNERMAALATKYDSKNQPAALRAPFEPAEVLAWGQNVRRFLEVEIPADLPFIDSLKGVAGVNGQRQSSLRHWVGGTWVRNLQERKRSVGDQVRGGLVEAERNAQFVLATDPNNPGHVANRILGEGSFDEQMQRLRRSLVAVDVAAAWDTAFGITDQREPREKTRALVESAMAHLREVAVTALEHVRVPVAASADEGLRKIAGETLAVEKYGVGDVVRLVINSDKQHREMSSGDIDVGTVRTTVTIYDYAWDEFQVCTVEKEGDEHWLYYNTLKHYTSGGPTTPLNRWILSQRFKSTRILEANIDKDPVPKTVVPKDGRD